MVNCILKCNLMLTDKCRLGLTLTPHPSCHQHSHLLEHKQKASEGIKKTLSAFHWCSKWLTLRIQRPNQHLYLFIKLYKQLPRSPLWELILLKQLLHIRLLCWNKLLMTCSSAHGWWSDCEHLLPAGLIYMHPAILSSGRRSTHPTSWCTIKANTYHTRQPYTWERIWHACSFTSTVLQLNKF